METKKMLAGILLVIIIILIINFLLPRAPVLKPTKIAYVYQYPNESVIVDVQNATNGTTVTDGSSRVIYKNKFPSTIFGYYKGNWLLAGRYMKNGKLLMRITPNLDPNNGVIEGYILPKIDETNRKVIFDVFLDKDWKNEVGDTNIIWAEKNLSFETWLNGIKKFEFNEISPGIYMDSVVSIPIFDKIEECMEGPCELLRAIMVTNGDMKDMESVDLGGATAIGI